MTDEQLEKILGYLLQVTHDNRAYLKTIVHNQVEILSKIENKPKEEIAVEMQEYYLKMY